MAKTSITTNEAPKSSVHFMLQGKGGVGKSLSSAVLVQYFTQDGNTCFPYDTDPVNQTLMNYKALNAKRVELMQDAKIDERNFDILMEDLLSKEGIHVVDNGASSFIPLANYLLENNAIQMLEDAGRNVYLHTVITGGQALGDTLKGFLELAEQAPTQNIVVWLNEYFGPIQSETPGENENDKPVIKNFLEMAAYQRHKNKVHGIVRIAKRNADTFGKDMQEMVTKKLTFSEALLKPEIPLMAKQRIRTIQKELYSQIDGLGF